MSVDGGFLDADADCAVVVLGSDKVAVGWFGAAEKEARLSSKWPWRDFGSADG